MRLDGGGLGFEFMFGVEPGNALPVGLGLRQLGRLAERARAQRERAYRLAAVALSLARRVRRCVNRAEPER
jgi:hypothetical protein